MKSLLSTILPCLVFVRVIQQLPFYLNSDIQKALNQNEITVSVLTDYYKAFDTTIHKILSYFNNRQQSVQIDGQTSPKSPVHFEVPQRSILDPTLFNIYVAELPSCIDSDSIQYADNTTIYRTCRPNDIVQQIHKLENNIKTVSQWSVENRLVFNNDNFKYITFSSKRKVVDKSYLIRSNTKINSRGNNCKTTWN